MKFFMSALLLSLISSAYAVAVEGEVFYKLPDGTMAVRDVILDVPEKGQGEVVLSGKSFEWRTKKFKSKTKNGQTFFKIVFNVEFEEKKSIQIFKGTYFKTSDHIKYYGSIYKKEDNKSKAKYIGGFEFNFERN